MKRTASFVLFSLLTLIITGCASSDPNQVNNGSESTIPWNRPANWEGQGQLGGLSGAGR